jgi:hypothetical protein
MCSRSIAISAVIALAVFGGSPFATSAQAAGSTMFSKSTPVVRTTLVTPVRDIVSYSWVRLRR